MFKDIMELAENKLLLLYIFNKVHMPISNSHITQIVLENNLINYFSLQQFLSELIESEFIKDEKKDRQHILTITPKGKDALEFFMNRIPEKRKETIDNYIKKNIENIKNDVEITAEYEQYMNGKYITNLKLANEGEVLIQLKLSLDTVDEARNLCNLWKQDPRAIYNKILGILKA
jgi:predicted transcriptional regulator